MMAYICLKCNEPAISRCYCIDQKIQSQLTEAQARIEELQDDAMESGRQALALREIIFIKEASIDRYKTAFTKLEDREWFGSKTSRQSLDIIKEEMTRIIQGDGRRE